MKAALLREYHEPLELIDRPVPELTHPNDVLVRIGGAGVCATDLHAIEGLMEPAGVTLPRVLGHENAGWVEEAGAGVTTVAKGDAVLVYPPLQLRPVRCVPAGQRHALRATPVHRPLGGRRVRRVRARLGAIASAASGRGRACLRGTACGCRAHRLPRRSAGGPPRRSRLDRRRDRGGRRRAHRAPACPRARFGHRDRGRHRRAPSPARCRVGRGRGARRSGRRSRGDERARRRPGLRLRRHRPDPRRARPPCWRVAARTR